MILNYEHTAQRFAQSFGFDGVLPNDAFPGNCVKILQDGSERYTAAFYDETRKSDPSLGWSIPFDNTAHTIIADANGARWEDGNLEDQHTFSQECRNPLIPDIA